MLARQPADKRTQLIETAVRLAHEQGFHQTTLADLARESGVPLGNVYYYFKTKQELGAALIDQMIASHAELRERWAARPDPEARLLAFIRTTVDNRAMLARSGCPIGSLCSELHKQGGALAERAAALFEQLLGWSTEQFRALGHGARSADLALHLLSSLQGASLVAHTFHDPRRVVREAAHLQAWVRGLRTRRPRRTKEIHRATS